MICGIQKDTYLCNVFNTKDVSTPNLQSDRQESGVLIRVKFLNRIDEIILTPLKMWGLLYLYHITLLKLSEMILLFIH